MRNNWEAEYQHERKIRYNLFTVWCNSQWRDVLQYEQLFGTLVFITVCECGHNCRQLMVVKVVVVVVVKNKYQLHFTTICTAASGPKRPPHYCAANSSASFLENEPGSKRCQQKYFRCVGTTETGIHGALCVCVTFQTSYWYQSVWVYGCW